MSTVTLILVMVSHVYAYVKTHQTVYVKYVQFFGIYIKKKPKQVKTQINKYFWPRAICCS